jgi:acyl-CoA thioester hydrolase
MGSDNGSVTATRRVIYGDTDAMGIVYYGNYLRYFEIGRNELFRACGGTYRDIEASGFALPVAEVGAKYVAPARYDDEIDIETRVMQASGARLRFEYRLRHHGNGQVLAERFTVHGCVAASTGRATRLPAELLKRLGLAGSTNEAP